MESSFSRVVQGPGQGKDIQGMHYSTMMLAGMIERFDNDMLKVVCENHCMAPFGWDRY